MSSAEINANYRPIVFTCIRCKKAKKCSEKQLIELIAIRVKILPGERGLMTNDYCD